MQPQLEEGEFCPPDYSTVICKAGPRVVWVGQRKSGFTRRCSVTMRRGETALAAATRKLNELKDNASLSDVPDDDSGRQSAEQQPAVTDEQQQPAATDEQQPAATEVVGQQGRPEREVRVPDFLQPDFLQRCKRAQMANFLLARAETGARGKLLMGGGAREKRAIFVDLYGSTTWNTVTQNNSPQHVM